MARSLFDAGDYDGAYRLCQSALQDDPHRSDDIGIVGVGSALQLKRCNDLFLLAHSLVESNPRNAASWYAVGCYYLGVNDVESAQKYFQYAALRCNHEE